LVACQSNEPVTVPTLYQTDTPRSTHTTMPTATASRTATTTPTLTPTNTPTETAIPTATFSPTPNRNDNNGARIPTGTPAPALESQTFAALSTQIDKQGMMQTVTDMVAFQTRHSNSGQGNGLTGIDTARDYLATRLNNQAANCANDATFFKQDFVLDYREMITTQSNLILGIEGTISNSPPFVLGAHYDTISKDPTLNPYGYQPGADDNASGVSVILELARLYCLQPRTQSVVFVLFAAEENRNDVFNGRIGSRQFLSNFVPSQGWRIQGMLNLDTIGSATDTEGQIVDTLARLYSAGGSSRQLARWIQAAAYVQLSDFNLVVEPREDRQNRWGDHMSFTRAGYPAVRLFEGSEDVDRQDSVQDLPNDLDPEYLSKNLQVVLAFLLTLGEGNAPPDNLQVVGTTLFWEPASEVDYYLVAHRPSTQESYTFTIIPATQTSIELPPDTIVTVGTINEANILGWLPEEVYIP